MIEFKGLSQPRMNIDVTYQLSISSLSKDPEKDPDNPNEFLLKLSKEVAKNGEGAHHALINGVSVKYHVLMTALSLPMKTDV